MGRDDFYNAFRGCLFQKWDGISNETGRFSLLLHGKNQMGQFLYSLLKKLVCCNGYLSLFKKIKHFELKCREKIKAIVS